MLLAARQGARQLASPVLPLLFGSVANSDVEGVEEECSRARSTENISSSDRKIVERKAASLDTCACLDSPTSALGTSFG